MVDGVCYVEVERVEGFVGDGELGEEVVKCDFYGFVVGVEDGVDGGWVVFIVSGNDLVCEYDILS